MAEQPAPQWPLEFGEHTSKRQAQILSAALSVFAEYGYEGGSMREIARRVGVSEAALYRHFSGKEEILATLIDAIGLTVRQEGLLRVQEMGAMTLDDDLRRLLADRRKTLRRLEPALRVIVPVIVRDSRWGGEMLARIVGPATWPVLVKVAEIDAALGVDDAERTRSARLRAALSLLAGYLMSVFILEMEDDDALADALARVMRWA